MATRTWLRCFRGPLEWSSGPVAFLVLLSRATPAGVVSPDLGSPRACRRSTCRSRSRDGRPSAGRGGGPTGGHAIRTIADDVRTALLHPTRRLRRRLDHGDSEDRVGHVVADG